MDRIGPDTHRIDRRNFLRSAGAGLAAAGTVLTSREHAVAQSLAEKARLDRLATCSYPLRSLFKTRQGAGRRGGGGAGPAAGAGSNATGRGQGPASGGPEGAAGGPAVTVPPDRDRTTAAEMKQRYGEITALDFPQWTRDTFPASRRWICSRHSLAMFPSTRWTGATPSIRPPPPANAGSTSSPTSS